MNRSSLPITSVFVVLAAGLVVVGCGSSTQSLQNASHTPNAYAVYQPADLSAPPEFKRRPTKTDAKAKSGASTRQVYRYASKRNDKMPTHWRKSSRGTQAFLYKLGAHEAEADIRVTINRETSIYLEEKETFVDGLLFGQGAPATTDVKISRETKGLLDKIF